MSRNGLLALVGFSLLVLAPTIYIQNQRTSLRSKAASQGESIEGKYLVDHRHEGDLRTGKSTTESFLEKDTGEIIKLRFSSSIPNGITPQSRIKVNGNKLADKEFSVAPASFPSSLQESDRSIIKERFGGNDIQVIQSKSRVLAATTARIVKLAVVLVNYKDYLVEPYNKDQITQEASTNVDSLEKYIEENSYGKIDLQVDVLGYITLDNFACEPSYQAVASKASQSNINLDNYQQIILTSPTDTAKGCTFHGGVSDFSRVAQILFKDGFTQPNKWRNYAMHELTHNFGATHSGNLSCANGGERVTISGSCTSDPGNRLDPFGIQGMSDNHLNVYNKIQTNFLSSTEVPTVSSSGTYTIMPFASSTGGTKGIKVAGGSRNYWLEFRQPYGPFDDFLATDSVVNGILIRTYNSSGFTGGPVILDNTPLTNVSQPNGFDSFLDGALTVGKVFYDSSQRISIETLSVSSSGAQVRITFNATQPNPTPVSTTPTTPPPPTAPPSPTPTVSIGSDTIPPSKPGELSAYPTSSGTYLVWSASTDNKGVSGYYITRNNVRVKTLPWPSTRGGIYYLDSGLSRGVSYVYRVQAYDAAGNISVYSNSITVTVR